MNAELEAALARGHALTVAGRLEAAEAALRELAAALHAPDSATWPELLAMVQANIGQCTTDVGGTGERCVLGAFHPGECDA